MVLQMKKSRTNHCLKKLEEIINFIKNCDLAGYNLIKFDIPLLAEELLRSKIEFNLKNCNIIDVQNIFKIRKRTLEILINFIVIKFLKMLIVQKLTQLQLMKYY